MNLPGKIYVAILLTTASLANTGQIAAQPIATFKDVAITVEEMRISLQNREGAKDQPTFSTMENAKSASNALLAPRYLFSTNARALALTQAEGPAFNLVRDRRYLEAVLEIVERRERDAAKAAPALLEKRAKEIYDAAPTGFKVPPKVKVAHVLIRLGDRSLRDATNLAEQVTALARGGNAWQTIVDAYSDDDKSKGSEGLVGDFYDNNSDHPMVVAAFRTSITNDIADPVVSRSGVHVVKIIKREAARRASFEESKEKIIEVVLNDRIRAAKEAFLESIKVESGVTYNEQLLSTFVEKPDTTQGDRLREIAQQVREGKLGPGAAPPSPAPGGVETPKPPTTK
jgi:parvulin-like peptidyl-prolyl isomerase